MAGLYPSNIIGAQHLQPLKDEIAKVKELIVEQNLAMQAGIGVAANTDKLKARLDKLNLFRQTYFPNQ